METQVTRKKEPKVQVSPPNSASAAKSKTRKTSGSRKSRADHSILTDELIAERAWKIWDRRGRVSGNDEDNWFEAIDQLREEMNSD